MSLYLRPQIIRNAIERLVESRAKSGLTDFLVLKRALTRCGSDMVPFSMTDPHFTGAIHELAATSPVPTAASSNLPGPFIKVFGTADVEKKYVSRKMLTNGPADTLSGPSWRGVVRITGSHPRRGGLQKGYEGQLAELLLKAGGKKPSLTDAAIWFYRAMDLETKMATVSRNGEVLLKELRDSFTNELGLTKREIGELFDGTDLPLPSTQPGACLQNEFPNPPEYLPGLEKRSLGDSAGDLREIVEKFVSDASSDEVALEVEDGLALRLAAALLAKRFLLLSGLAGSGKTKLAQAFARWLTPPQNPNPRVAVIPVGADWTGNENILGYPDGLDALGYVSRPALQLLLNAKVELDTPHFLILDEMNLSHVERYFADLLSAIESGEEIPLYEGGDRAAGAHGIPQKLRLPPNLFIIGTVNVDETTYMFSPKVLDRANVIEFRMEREEMESFLSAPVAPDLSKLAGLGASFGKTFVGAASAPADVPTAVEKQYTAEMLLHFDILREHGAEFGFRVGHEASRFLHFYQKLGGFPENDKAWFDAAFDAVIVQKLLPKLHGSRSSLEGLLWALARACGAERAGRSSDEFLNECREAGKAQDETQFGPEVLSKALADKQATARYPLSFDKVMRMWRKLVRDQFASFAEA